MKQISSQFYNGSDFAEDLAKRHGLSLKTSSVALKTVFDEVTKALLNGQRVEIRGFGSFVVRKYKGYKGRNPRNRESIRVKPKRAPFFKVGKVKEKLQSGRA